MLNHGTSNKHYSKHTVYSFFIYDYPDRRPNNDFDINLIILSYDQRNTKNIPHRYTFIHLFLKFRFMSNNMKHLSLYII